jgi:hypothetical protein
MAARQAALVVAGAMLAGGLTAVPAAPSGSVRVAVLPLPRSMSSQTSPETQQLATRLAGKLRSAGFRVVVTAVAPAVPLEEQTATANAIGAALALAVRSVRAPKQCPVVLAPSAVSPPVQPKGGVSQAELPALIKQLTASSRFEASARLADAISSGGGWCRQRPTAVERFVFETTSMPTVVISVAPRDADSLTDRIPGLVEQWIVAETK